MYCNELIFVIHASLISASSLVCLRLGANALVSFVCTCCILANLFVIKQVTLLGLSATGADAFTIGAVLGLNMLQEYHGKQSAQTAIIINFFLLVFYAIMSHIHLAYLPSATDIMHEHFSCICAPMPRIVIASFTVYLIAQWCDYRLYGFLKTYWKNRFLLVRNYASLVITQLLDTVLFTMLGLYGLVDNVWHVILVSYTIKVCAIAITTPFIALSRWETFRSK